MNRIVAIDSIRTFALITLMLFHVVIFLSLPNKDYHEKKHKEERQLQLATILQ